MSAPPCLPVAPETRMLFVEAMAYDVLLLVLENDGFRSDCMDLEYFVVISSAGAGVV